MIDRASFHVPGPGPYLLTHSVGCVPRIAVDALQQSYLQPWMSEGGDAWAAWLRAVDAFRSRLAELLGGVAGDYCPQPNISAGLSKLVGALPQPGAGKRVWLAAEDSFPSLAFVLSRAERLGYLLRLIPRDHCPSRLETWTDALTPDVCGVLVTHVHSNTGVVAPVAEIAAACARKRAVCVVDVAQSAGIVPLSVDAIGADVVLGSCVKWLCGGPGAGFLWIKPALLRLLQPVDVGWFSHADPFEFDGRHFEYASDARRFWGGTPAVAPYVLAASAIAFVNQIGVDRIHDHNRQLKDYFADCLPPRWRHLIPREPSGGTLCLRVGAALGEIQSALRSSGSRFDNRGGTLRLSFHCYNGAEDVERAARAWPRN